MHNLDKMAPLKIHTTIFGNVEKFIGTSWEIFCKVSEIVGMSSVVFGSSQIFSGNSGNMDMEITYI